MIDFDLERVFVRGQEVDLTDTEYAVLSELIRHTGQTLTAGHLLDLMRPVGERGEAQQIQELVLQLRRKIEPDPENPKYIVSQAGAGYGFRSPD